MNDKNRLRRKSILIGAIALVATLGGTRPARAQIYEWRDDANDSHFATSLDEVPDEARAKARVVVNAPQADEPAVAETSDGTRDEEQTADREAGGPFATGWDEGFNAGWEAGFRAAAEQQPVCPAQPEVVVMESPAPAPVVVNVPAYDPTGAYYQSPYAGTLTVPFDFGASRGLTRREQIQNERMFERGW